MAHQTQELLGWIDGLETGKLAGPRIVRNGSAANPAYLIEMIDGREVLKLGSELSGE